MNAGADLSPLNVFQGNIVSFSAAAAAIRLGGGGLFLQYLTTVCMVRHLNVACVWMWLCSDAPAAATRWPY